MNLRTIQNVEGTTSKQHSITDEQLILNLPRSLSSHIKEVTPLNWCPTVEQLLEEKSVSQLLLKLLFSMKKKNGHKELSEEADLVLIVLGSLISYFITGKKANLC